MHCAFAQMSLAVSALRAGLSLKLWRPRLEDGEATITTGASERISRAQLGAAQCGTCVCFSQAPTKQHGDQVQPSRVNGSVGRARVARAGAHWPAHGGRSSGLRCGRRAACDRNVACRCLREPSLWYVKKSSRLPSRFFTCSDGSGGGVLCLSTDNTNFNSV